jgi:hypothetical protein
MLLSKLFPVALTSSVVMTVAIAPSANAVQYIYQDFSGGTIEGIDPFLFPGSDGTFTTQIFVPESFAISNMSVSLFGLTSGDADSLSASLTHVDTGTSISLFNSLPSGSTLDGAYIFDDSVTGGLNTAPSIDTGLVSDTYNPGGSLFDFNGELASGTWELSFLNTSDSFAAAFSGWQVSFNLIRYAIEGTLGLSTIPNYTNALIQGYISVPQDAEDLDPGNPNRGLFNISDFVFTVTANGDTTPFASIFPDASLPPATLEVSSRRISGRGRTLNENPVCDPDFADFNFFFATEDPDKNVVPLLPPPVDTFVPEESSLVFFGPNCEEDGEPTPIEEVTNSEVLIPPSPPEQPPESVPEPTFTAALGLLGLGWLAKKKRR